jgi:hypothetical protein
MPDATASEIALDQACAGMTLAAALTDDHGAVLLPPETALTEAVLAALRRRGVTRCVVWQRAPADPAQQERLRQQRLQRLAHLFRHNADAPGNAALLLQLRAYHEQRP